MMLTIGIDIGSTTAKIAVLNEQRDTVFSAYRRHNADIRQALSAMLQETLAALGDVHLRVCITGSAGMGIAERSGIPFIQEAVSCASVVRHRYPDVRTLLDVGGEDTKLIFFDDHTRPDIRMNGNCAGGTGAFIDQMATLLDVDVAALDALAVRHRYSYPIASRCGVFAKTDVQNLISRQIPKEDIAATIFQAVALQTKNTLARGRDREPKVLFCGGPLTFFASLRNAFADVFQICTDDIVLPRGSHLLPAIGAALNPDGDSLQLTLRELIARAEAGCAWGTVRQNTVAPLFADTAALEHWSATRMRASLGRVTIEQLDGEHCYLGIDSGSTTTKIVLIDSTGTIAFTYYTSNKGEPITAVSAGLHELRKLAGENGGGILIAGSAVTGYGEDLIRAAFGLDEGIVETLAHYRAAREFNPAVTFILDIGGQDMKAIFIEGGQVRNVEINEACSSGCGSFLETFANSLDLGVEEFAGAACSATAPCDLGSRCTVFMNSRVKQSLREGTSVPDIAAGLAYSVIRNCIQKVLKIHDPKVLGEEIVVQGGTFRNPAVHRALERIVGKSVLCPDIPELMGAYGAALTARDGYAAGRRNSLPIPLSRLAVVPEYTTKSTGCRGCENNCAITTFGFSNGTRYFTGNKCEKVFTNRGLDYTRGENLAGTYTELLFGRRLTPEGTPRLTIGIPRVLNIYENFPFWCTLFVESGIAVQLSPVSTNALCDRGSGTIMSDNICFPAKLVHGHIQSLMESGVDRIFYPMVFHENEACGDTEGSWNCPVVAAYPDVIRSAINPERKSGIPFDTPTVSFRDITLLKKSCFRYLASLGVPAGLMRKAFQLALDAQHRLKSTLRDRAKTIIADSENTGRPLVVLAARPYHLDPLVNHKVPDILADFGANVLTVDALPDDASTSAQDIHVLPQWSYPNRLFKAARWVAAHPWAELVQLNSFGCGPDALTVDETKSLLSEHGRNHTLLRIDEVTSPGSLRLRIRSMLESVRRREGLSPRGTQRASTRVFQREDRSRTILAPFFAPFYSSFIAAPFETMGYKVEVLPPSDRDSLEWGLRYTNNEICYPAILIIGDIIKALRSGRYDPRQVAIGLTQTGGQCRASNYVPLLRKALVAAGYAGVPAVSVSTSQARQNEQPGFSLHRGTLMRTGLWAIAYGDALARMYYSTNARELHEGAAGYLVDTYAAAASDAFRRGDPDTVLALLSSAVREFNGIPVRHEPLPRIGIVGEIYVKYNEYSNNGLLHWLRAQGVEVDLPPLIDFFTQWFVNVDADRQTLLARQSLGSVLASVAERAVETRLDRIERILEDYVRYRPRHTIRHLASRAARVLSLADQFGEGWLIPAEIAALAEEGVEHVVCLQPFGCIANHIVAKGVEKRMRDLYPRLDLLFLDMDAGAGEANLHNRLHFVVQGAKEAVAQTPGRHGVKGLPPAHHGTPAVHASASTADILSA